MKETRARPSGRPRAFDVRGGKRLLLPGNHPDRPPELPVPDSGFPGTTLFSQLSRSICPALNASLS